MITTGKIYISPVLSFLMKVFFLVIISLPGIYNHVIQLALHMNSTNSMNSTQFQNG